ncbi:MAG: redoxin domain-containing protein [Gemmatimonadota bacterium]|jgi:peroxiredoxin Q/BCP|nr:redoxin domain-containing protein [Gemmatimonadota bacterium]MDQ8147006.1 redoxin domain-containing protein [Gemmatimonadota bacterium]MDQ8148729.1 redoxin domain-containing protein [Gemmatimonadota bacterium]MDQ8156137.1 redoxin domain-containing protein [Gemmatimonadota bacterium]MDQ8170417.1 redoxin domain-containing protein [Gemmatimonadota bacterium]
MRRPLSLVTALALLAFAAPAQGQGATDGGPKVGDLAPDFTLPASTKSGIRPSPVNLRALRGQTVVLAFFPKVRTGG